MRQASWEDLFRSAEELGEPVKKPSLLWRLISWEDILTLVIVIIAFLTVVGSINSADWVRLMPSLFPIAFFGLAAGFVLSKLRFGEITAHLIALALGVVGVLHSATSKVEGSIFFRLEDLADRMWIWGKAVYEGGISNDNLPFVVLVVAASYLMAYLAAWSLFRWYNAWLALIPAGLVLLTNISYLPGQHSLPLLIFLFCAILLLARTNLLRNAREWRRENAGYPDYISLHVLNVTVWVALLLLAVSWLMPIGGGSGALLSLWRTVTAPIVEPLNDFGRVFSAIDSKKGGSVHNFGSTLPLQGAISLSNREVMTVVVAEPGFLRAQSYDEYTAQGWKIGPASSITQDNWPALQAMQSIELAREQLRRPVSALVTLTEGSSVIVSMGQPFAVTTDTRVVFGPDQTDITSVRAASSLGAEDQYRADSTLSNASVERLQGAGTAYPAWIEPYVQLPSDLPSRIRDKASEVAAGATNPYDQAIEIEQYLRTFGIDIKIPVAGPRQDSVDYFLFDVQRGYFDYHASAMVVMLRSLGVPARISVGYVIRPQDRTESTDSYRVSEANSFAWPEVYFPGLGWVEFNPTPSEPRVARTGTDDAIVSGLDDAVFFEEDFYPEPAFGDSEPAARVIEEFVAEEGSSVVGQALLGVVLVFLGVTVVGGGIYRFGWQHGMAGLDYPSQVWEKMLRLSRWGSIRIQPQETPREVTQRLRRELPEVDDLDYLSESYIRSRYGHKELNSAEKERLDSVWKQARRGLMRRVLRRK